MKRILFYLLLLLTSFRSYSQLYFPPNGSMTWDTISPSSLNWCQQNIDSLYAMLDSNNTKSFILLKDGKIVLEKYFDNQTVLLPWYWASAGKSLTAFMVGLAQQDGFLNITDTTSQYLGQGWTNCTVSDENKITVWNQLTMTSGLDDNGVDPYCTDDTCLNCIAAAGQRWAYHNGPYTLLDGVISNATGQTLNNYIDFKLKTITGMDGLFLPSGYNNVFYSTARSMARYGLLILNNGNWNGNQIMTDTSYFNAMINTSQNLNPSYGYLWWLNGKPTYMVPGLQISIPGPLFPDAPTDVVSALGKNGQFINVCPSQNMVWIRMGDAPDNSLVPFLLNDSIWKYINNLSCTTASLNSNEKDNKLTIYPVPAHKNCHVSLSGENLSVSFELFTSGGKMIRTGMEAGAKFDMDLSDIAEGVYFFRLISGKDVYVRRLIIN